MQIRCPQCKTTLQQQDKSWRCENNHCFDTAKQGYTNLLLVQKKRSRSPGDDAEMVESRQRFLNTALYQPISDSINTMVLAHSGQHTLQVLDAGCGEGYYTQRLGEQLETSAVSHRIVGIDISKFAVKAAARRSKACQWFVANSNDLPISDHSVDVLLSLFSPLPSEEFARVCNNNGICIVASTGPKHLIEMRERLYDQVDDQCLEPADKLAPLFSRIAREKVQTTLQLDNSQCIEDLLSMTPHYWRASPERKQQLCQTPSMNVTLDVHLHCFKRSDF